VLNLFGVRPALSEFAGPSRQELGKGEPSLRAKKVRQYVRPPPWASQRGSRRRRGCGAARSVANLAAANRFYTFSRNPTTLR
jgi:hypothetical protein